VDKADGVPRPAKAGAADVTERERPTGNERSEVRRTDCPRASVFAAPAFAGRGTTFARSTERDTLASDSDPRQGLGSSREGRPMTTTRRLAAALAVTAVAAAVRLIVLAAVDHADADDTESGDG